MNVIVDPKTGKVKRRPKSSEGAVVKAGESSWGTGLLEELQRRGLNPGEVGETIPWFDPQKNKFSNNPPTN